jgi:hypothetical protein
MSTGELLPLFKYLKWQNRRPFRGLTALYKKDSEVTPLVCGTSGGTRDLEIYE